MRQTREVLLARTGTRQLMFLWVAFVRTREGAGRRQLLETSTRVLQL